MVIKEQDIVLVEKDEKGNKVIQMPITRVENVEGAIKTVNKVAPDATGNVAINTVANATKATQDGSGNIITSTYATKTEVTQGLAGKANASHTHTTAQVTGLDTALAGKEDKGTCLPLTGGTVLGDILNDPVQRDELFLGHSFADKSGAFLAVRSANRSGGEHGTFLLGARTPEKECYLEGYPNGDLVWGGNIVDGIVGQGDGWVRYNSGLQICWGWREFTVNLVPWGALYEAKVSNFITFPMPFKYTPIVTTTANNNFTPQQGVEVSPTGIGDVWFWFAQNLQDRITATGYIAIGVWR